MSAGLRPRPHWEWRGGKDWGERERGNEERKGKGDVGE